jgi:hypothetical protein
MQRGLLARKVQGALLRQLVQAAIRFLMVSVNRLKDRKRGLRINDWIMDSGAFSEISTHGRWTEPYAEQVSQEGCSLLLLKI